MKKGDIVLYTAYSWQGHLLAFWEALFSKDEAASHDHAAVAVSENTVLSTTYTFTHYEGCSLKGKTVISLKGITPEQIDAGLKGVSDQLGRFYPYWRLPLFVLGLAKYIHWKSKVCSELTACYLHYAGYWPGNYWGVSPDDIYDYAKDHPELFDIIT